MIARRTTVVAIESSKHFKSGISGSILLHNVRHHKNTGQTQDKDERDIDQRGKTGGACEVTLYRLSGNHDNGPKGCTIASMLKCSAESGDRVVGAKKLARVKRPDCSISPTSAAAFRVIPVRRSLLPSTCTSVT